MTTISVKLCAAIVLVSASALVAQPKQGAIRRLAKPQVESAEALSGIADLRELSDGRVLALDGKDNEIQLFAADLQSVRKVSRVGGGPTEYRLVSQLLARPADTTLAYDVMSARFLVIDRTGAPTSTISLQSVTSGMPVGPVAVRGYDRQGRLYYQGLKVSMGPNGPAISDTAPILRLDPATKRVDTLALVKTGSPGMRTSGGGQGKQTSVSLNMAPWPIVDEWGLLPDGRVAIVRGVEYRIDFVGGTGAPSSTGPIAHERVKVAAIDKKKLLEERQEMKKQMDRAVASAQAAAPSSAKGRPPRVNVALEEPTEWPEYKPAFTQGALKVTPDGELWVMRLRSAANEQPLYDVFAPNGVLRMRVEFPARTRVAGFGAGVVYTTRADEDDLQYLQRWPRP